MLTRVQFNDACQALALKYTNDPNTPDGLRQWHWKTHAHLTQMGYLSRTVLIPRTTMSGDKSSEVDIDEAAVNHRPAESLTCHQSVAYSASFQAPAFYFTIHDSNGSPLPISDIVKTSLFRAAMLEGTEVTTYAVSVEAAPFPLLSQGDHPVLGTPSWYLHPCETATAVNEIVDEVAQPNWDEEIRLVRWMEAWFMIVGAAVDLRVL